MLHSPDLLMPLLKRQMGVALWSSVMVFAALVFSLWVGRLAIPIDIVVMTLASKIVALESGASKAQAIVILDVRLPRALLACVCGAGLALAGAVLQGVLRNPLVGPQTIGVSSGASFGGVGAILLLGFGPLVIPAAFIGAVVALAAVLSIGRLAGGLSILTLVLAGIVVGAFFAALVSLATFFADPETQLPGIVYWLMGSFALASWQKLAVTAPVIIAGSALLLAMRWRINVLSLGEDDARALGIPVTRDRMIVLGAVCLIVAAQVSASGSIGWIGLVIPHVARLVVGPDHRLLLPVATAMGAAYTMAMDALSRTILPAEIPVGILTALVGAPVLAALLARHARGGQ
jgi:iron complex transport system permease protein